jgi:AbrB family looped-hinge helix DNA binding protein
MILPRLIGTSTVGERGQIVVPADARTELGINAGDKLLVFKAPIDGALIIAKPETFEKLIAHMGAQFNNMKDYDAKKTQ